MRQHLKRWALTAAAALPVAVMGVFGAGTTGAFAYGSADQPIAQVEISANCNNSSFELCSSNNVGLGGVWAWAELDTTGSTTTSGTMDATFAGCGHVIGGGGPGTAGAHGGPVPGGTWEQFSSLGAAEIAAEQANTTAFPFYDTSTYTGSVYLMDFFPGSGEDDFVAVVPAPEGHYSWHPAPGVTIETQVAP